MAGMNPADEPVPANLLLPALAVDGKVDVIVVLRVPVPDDPGVPRTLAALLDVAEVAGIGVDPVQGRRQRCPIREC